MIVGAAVNTTDPVHLHASERDAVAFQMVDTFSGDTARGDYGGPMRGVVRPLLRWEALGASDPLTTADDFISRPALADGIRSVRLRPAASFRFAIVPSVGNCDSSASTG